MTICHNWLIDWFQVFRHVRSPGHNEYLPADHTTLNENRIPDQLQADANNATKLSVAAQNTVVKLVWQSIFPTLIDLQAKGKKLSLVDSESLWTWEVGKEVLSSDVA
jgi:hypothetical protein